MGKRKRRERRELHELPVRQCRYGERCLVCLGRIEAGERYHDGSHGRRVHLTCAEEVRWGKRREPTRAEVRELEEAEIQVSRLIGVVYVATTAAAETEARGDLVVAQALAEGLRAKWAQVGGDGG
jgi:hypothetical protein